MLFVEIRISPLSMEYENFKVHILGLSVDPLYSVNPLRSTFANVEDSNEMQHSPALLVKVKKILRQKETIFL